MSNQKRNGTVRFSFFAIKRSNALMDFCARTKKYMRAFDRQRVIDHRRWEINDEVVKCSYGRCARTKTNEALGKFNYPQLEKCACVSG